MGRKVNFVSISHVTTCYICITHRENSYLFCKMHGDEYAWGWDSLFEWMHSSMTIFEIYIVRRCPCGLQLFVWSDYRSVIYKDIDYNNFTLAYISNRDVEKYPNTMVDFILDGAIILWWYRFVFFQGMDIMAMHIIRGLHMQYWVGYIVVNCRFGNVKWEGGNEMYRILVGEDFFYQNDINLMSNLYEVCCVY